MAGACAAEAPSDKFQILKEFDHPLLPRWRAFLAANDIEVAGVEFIVDEAGRAFTYDINTNTNYNPDAEAKTAAEAWVPSRAISAACSWRAGSRAQNHWCGSRSRPHEGSCLFTRPYPSPLRGDGCR